MYFYIPSTSTPKATYKDPAQTILNTNPVVLDANGQAVIWGSGTYRQVVYDVNNNLIWDQITEDTSGALLGNMTDDVFVAGTDFTPGTTTQLTLTAGPGSISNTWIYFDAAYQADAQASVSGTTLTFTSPIPVGVGVVTVKIGSTVAIGTPGSGTVTDSSIASGTKLYNRIHDIFDLRDYGGVNDGVSDNTHALNAAIVAAGAVNGSIYIPGGNWAFKSKPNDITQQLGIFGDGLNSTVLLRDYVEAGVSTGFFNINGVSGISIRGLAIDATSTSSGGSLINALSSATIAGSIVLEDLWLSTLGSNNLNYILVIDGSAKTTGALGFRDSALRNVHVFGANNISCSLKSVDGLSWYGGGIYAAGSTGAGSGELQITGVSGVSSNNVIVDIYTASNISLDTCNNIDLRIPAFSGTISNASSATTCSFRGGTPGTVMNNWTGSLYDCQGPGYSQGGTQQFNTLHNGRWENFGQIVFAGGSSQALTFPAPFTNNVESVSFGASGNVVVFYTALSLTGMTIGTSAPFTGTIFYRVSGR